MSHCKNYFSENGGFPLSFFCYIYGKKKDILKLVFSLADIQYKALAKHIHSRNKNIYTDNRKKLENILKYDNEITNI